MSGAIPVEYMLQALWKWIITHGLVLVALTIVGMLIPRLGRRVIMYLSRTIEEGTEAAKGRRAIVGAMVYMAEAIAYTVLIVAAMDNLGVNLAAAAIPATVVSAAVGFGSQKIIGDLLGGCFIIIEKQYGVGDWVTFHGSTAQVEGDVVDMTLRATTIRTLNGNEVTVPNGEARVCVNASARWARAVVSIPIPVTAGSSMAEINRRTLAAAERAIADPEVAEQVRSEITFQPATEVAPPTAMGLPWTTTIRIMIDVAPGKQWLVERAVRAAVLDEWWEDYGKRASDNTILDEEIGDSIRSLLDVDEVGDSRHKISTGISSEPRTAVESAAVANAAENTEVPREQVLREIEEREEKEVEETEPHKPGPFTFGGRVRASTTLLIYALMFLGILWSMTLSDEESGQAGWLAPTGPVATTSEYAPEPAETTPATPIETPQVTPEAPAETQQSTTHEQPVAPTRSVAPDEPEEDNAPGFPGVPDLGNLLDRGAGAHPGEQESPSAPTASNAPLAPNTPEAPMSETVPQF